MKKRGTERILVTGGAGFIGSHIAEFYAKKGKEVAVFDNLSRAEMLEKADKTREDISYNWNYLKRYKNIRLIKGDIRKRQEIENEAKNANLIVHAAGQVAVTSSIENPTTDFEVNAVGTFNVLEAARKSKGDPAVLYLSTNKVYGENVNKIPVSKKGKRYLFADKHFDRGISEMYPIDLTGHTPYGCSKLTGDLYAQDYSKTYGLDTCVFRMSCIYGTRQFGNEDQGWVAHFIISTLQNRKLTIYGDGKQVRDVLFVSDLVTACDSFLNKRKEVLGEVFNIGGGPDNTLSLLELLNLLKKLTNKKSEISFQDWRTGDQRVYISDISKAKTKLGWQPSIDPLEGVQRFIAWHQDYKQRTS